MTVSMNFMLIFTLQMQDFHGFLLKLYSFIWMGNVIIPAKEYAPNTLHIHFQNLD